MNRIKKIIFAVLIFVMIAVSMFPISSYAALTPFIFNFSKPYVSSTTGYIAISGERTDLDNMDQAFIFYYQCTPTSNATASYISETPLFVIEDIYANALYFNIDGDFANYYQFSFCLMHENGEIQDLGSHEFGNDFKDGVIYLNSNFLINGIDCHGNIDRSALDDEYPAFEYLFVEDKYDYIYLITLLNVLYEYGDLLEEEQKLLQDIVDSNNLVSDMLTQIKTEFGTKLDTIINDNVEFKRVLQELLSSSEHIDETLGYFFDEACSYLYLIESDLLEIWFSVDELESNTDEIEELLQKLLDEFTYTGTNVITQPDTSVLDGYYAAEGELLDNLQLSAPLNVDINSNALAFCWDTVELFFLSHDKVLAAVLVVLSFGIMALVLGR